MLRFADTLDARLLQVAVVVCLLVAVVTLTERIVFVAGSDTTVATVRSFESKRDWWCTSAFRRCWYELATVHYEVRGLERSAQISREGFYPRLELGDQVPVRYARSRPSRAFRDSVWDVFYLPLSSLVGMGVLILALRLRHRA